MIRSHAPSSITLRAETPTDRALSLAAFASTRSAELALVGWTRDQEELFIAQQFEAQQHCYRSQFPQADFDIVSIDGFGVGRCYVDRDAQGIRLIDIVLLPEWRGIGIGARLLDALLVEADRQGLPIHLHVEKHNPVLAWYARLGFVASGDAGMHWAMRREPRPQACTVEAVA